MKPIKIAMFKDKSNNRIIMTFDEWNKCVTDWIQLTEWDDWEPEPIVERPYYMKNEYELINEKEFGLRDLYKAWNEGHIDHYNKPRSLSYFDRFIEVAKKREWINEE